MNREPSDENARPPRVLLTVEDAAQRLSIGRTTMYALIRDRQIRTVQIGHLRRVPHDALTDYAAGLTQRQPA